MNACPCGSGAAYEVCCGPLIEERRAAPDAEALMRSRYSAFVRGEVDYILATTHPARRGDYDRKSVESWSRNSQWHGLEILATQGGGSEDENGTVEFVAHFSENDQRQRHHEIAQFMRHEGRWTFYDGQAPKTRQYVRETPKVGRNAPCPCGSGRKFKKCCGLQAG